MEMDRHRKAVSHLQEESVCHTGSEERLWVQWFCGQGWAQPLTACLGQCLLTSLCFHLLVCTVEVVTAYPLHKSDVFKQGNLGVQHENTAWHRVSTQQMWLFLLFIFMLCSNTNPPLHNFFLPEWRRCKTLILSNYRKRFLKLFQQCTNQKNVFLQNIRSLSSQDVKLSRQMCCWFSSWWKSGTSSKKLFQILSTDVMAT